MKVFTAIVTLLIIFSLITISILARVKEEALRKPAK